jgi:hypothetical protein
MAGKECDYEGSILIHEFPGCVLGMQVLKGSCGNETSFTSLLDPYFAYCVSAKMYLLGYIFVADVNSCLFNLLVHMHF